MHESGIAPLCLQGSRPMAGERIPYSCQSYLRSLPEQFALDSAEACRVECSSRFLSAGNLIAILALLYQHK